MAANMKLLLCIIGLASAFADHNDSKQFLADMFQEVAKVNEGKSVILSAVSVLFPLAQLALASTGPSHDELLTAIGLPDDDKVMTDVAYVNEHLKNVKDVSLTLASRIYIAQDAKINETFAMLSRVFNSDVKNVDFSKNVQSAQEINAWVEQQTNNKIKNLVGPNDINESTRSILVNAIYFKGEWKTAFNRRLTEDQDFHVSKSNTVKVPTMSSRHGGYKYGESAELDAKLVAIPYKDMEASLLIVLPNKIDGLSNLEKKIADASVLNKAVGEMHYQGMELYMPRFKIETKTNLVNVLQKMNITKLFSPTEAKLDNLLVNEGKMFISHAIQKAFIEVNEEGTEATAANEFGLAGLSGSLSSPMVVRVDRPFYFEIRYYNIVLFSGAVVNP